MKFSQRQRLTPVKKALQINSMDMELRNSLWSYFKLTYLDYVQERYTIVLYGSRSLIKSARPNEGETFILNLWLNHFKEPIDTIPYEYKEIVAEIRGHFFRVPWYGVYDFIETVVENYPGNEINKRFMELCNYVLEKELSGYRFIRGKIVQITSEEEMLVIEKALNVPSLYKGPRAEIKVALDKLSNRKSPDYRGSIKNSISAIEGVARIITGQPKVPLGKALKMIKAKAKFKLHPALESAFIKLYGYTSNSKNGIRHALLDEPNLGFPEAKFMLVSCSAFMNYLIDKTR